MEESAWLAFGVIAAILMIGIVFTLFNAYREDSSREGIFQGVQQLGLQAEQVCQSPRNTRLSIDIPVPAGTRLYTTGESICAAYRDDVRCASTQCALEEATVLDLTDERAAQLGTRTYTCSVENQGALLISCEG